MNTSQAHGRSAMAGMLIVLAALLGVGAILIWTLDAGPDSLWRGAGMAGLGAVVGAFGIGLRRPASALLSTRPTPGTWRRVGMGAPWTDWVAPLIPIVLVALPLLFIIGPSDPEVLAKLGILVGLLELFVLPAFLLARREIVAIATTTDGFELTRRNGTVVRFSRRDVSRIELHTRRVRGFAFHELALHHTRGTIKMRGPLDTPPSEVVHELERHLTAS